jgi:hypothetical protein
MKLYHNLVFYNLLSILDSLITTADRASNLYSSETCWKSFTTRCRVATRRLRYAAKKAQSIAFHTFKLSTPKRLDINQKLNSNNKVCSTLLYFFSTILCIFDSSSMHPKIMRYPILERKLLCSNKYLVYTNICKKFNYE